MVVNQSYGYALVDFCGEDSFDSASIGCSSQVCDSVIDSVIGGSWSGESSMPSLFVLDCIGGIDVSVHFISIDPFTFISFFTKVFPRST